MKKLMIASLLLLSIGLHAQSGERPNRREMAKALSAEEMATLQTKKMTLALVLSESQTKKVYPLVLEQIEDRKAMREARKTQDEKAKLTDEQRYERANAKLDKQITFQNQMKEILTEEQFEKFSKHHARKGKRGGRDHGHKGRKRQRRTY